MPNGIDLLLLDHEQVASLFGEFASSANGSVVGELIDKLKAHDDAEHAALYPLAGRVLRDRSLIERSAAAHSAVKKQIDLLSALEGAPLMAAVDALRKMVDKHVADEEKNLFPALSSAATRQQLDALGARILQAKQRGG